MKRTHLIALVLVAALAFATPVVAREWIQKPFVTAAEQMLATMPADFYQMDPTAVQRLMETAKPLVLDVREKAEWDAERIAGATHVPIRDLAKFVEQLPDSKGAPIVTVCKIGYRAGIAMTLLRMWGYTNVRAMRGGMDAWKAAGLPVTK
ncbi:MAG: rhodanese-like domain-containing protein [Armatimonadetes bacterium]|nr:rhodanese-like domain-containing protein [Armatimonadota bacterium]